MSDVFGYESDNLDELLNRAGGFTQAADSLTWPSGAGLGQARIVAGANTPAELVAVQIPVALLFYDIESGVEVGYHFIASSSTGPPAEATLLIGYVTYTVPGDPNGGATVHFMTQYGDAVSDTTYITNPMLIATTMNIFHGGNLAGSKYAFGENGLKTFNLVAANSATATINYVGSYQAVPLPFTNITAVAAASARWGSRAINLGLNSFDIFIFKGDAADPAFTGAIDVTWDTRSRF